jgi:hypothetical protein
MAGAASSAGGATGASVAGGAAGAQQGGSGGCALGIEPAFRENEKADQPGDAPAVLPLVRPG